MYLDADEVIVPEDAEKLRALTGRTWREAFYLVETNYTGEQGDGTALTHNALRIFRNRPEYRFEGRLHEQIAQNLPGVPTGADRAHDGSDRALRLPRQRPQRQGEVAAQHRAAARAAGREPADPVPAFQPRLRVRRGRRRAGGGGGVRAGVGDAQGRAPTAYGTSSRRRWSSGSSRRCASADAHRMRSSWPIDGLELFPASPTSCSSKASASVALGRVDDAISYYERCIEMGDAPAATRPRSAAGPTSRGSVAGRAASCIAATAALRESCSNGAWRSIRASSAPILPYAATLLRSGIAPERRRRRSSSSGSPS